MPLAIQQVSVQSGYWLLPIAVAAMFAMDAAAAAALLSVSLLASAFGTFLQGATKSWISSGYAIAFVPAPIFMSVFAGAAAAGVGFSAVSAAFAFASLTVMILVLMAPRILQLISPEIMGVVVFSIGIAFLPRMLTFLDQPASAERETLVIFAVAFAAIVFFAVAPTRMRPYAILTGIAAGSALGLLLVGPEPKALQAFTDARLLDWPRFTFPDFGGVDGATLTAAFVAVFCHTAHQLANLLLFQREQDASWTKPDLPPIRRGIAASNLANVFGCLIGSAPVASSSPNIALSVATRSFSRHVIHLGAAAVAVLACSPKFAAMFLLIPKPVMAALFLYLGAILMSVGARLITGRVLDARRTLCVGFGLACGIATFIAPQFLTALLPDPMVTPVVLSFLGSFLMHALTLPLVRQSAAMELTLDRDISVITDHFIDNAAGNFALRTQTADRMRHALLEVAELLADRGVKRISVRAAAGDGQARLVIEHQGPALPAPALKPSFEDFEDRQKTEHFTMWMAARHAVECLRSAAGPQASVIFTFQD